MPCTGDSKEKKRKSSKKKSTEADSRGASPMASTPFMIKPESSKAKIDTSTWPLLLRNYDALLCRTSHYTPIPSGCSPLKRELKEYIRYGVINLDKPANPSSHEVRHVDDSLNMCYTDRSTCLSSCFMFMLTRTQGTDDLKRDHTLAIHPPKLAARSLSGL